MRTKRPFTYLRNGIFLLIVNHLFRDYYFLGYRDSLLNPNRFLFFTDYFV